MEKRANIVFFMTKIFLNITHNSVNCFDERKKKNDRWKEEDVLENVEY